MAKKNNFNPNERAADFELGFDPAIALGKMPTNIAGASTPMADFMEIPLDKLIEFRGKSGADFLPWPEEKFQLLVESIKKHGVIEPISVRIVEGKQGYYEIMAGEHRWKASKELQLATIPARVFDDCDDQTASDIFAATNVLRRENTLRDKVNGWWHYLRMVKRKDEDDIQEMLESGVLSYDVHEEAQKAKRTVYRFAKLHELIDELLDMAQQKKLSIEAAEQLAYIPREQQFELLSYKESLNNLGRAQKLHRLAAGTYEVANQEGTLIALEWTKKNIEAILFPIVATKANSLKEVTTRVKTIIQSKMQAAAYGEVENIVSQAIDEYLEKHPEFKKKEKA